MTEFPNSSTYVTPSRGPLRRATFVQAWRRFFRRYFEFKGFASRSEYWWVNGLLALISSVSQIPALGIQDFVFDSVPLSLLALLISLFLLIPGLALAWRRLHDAGFAGPWWFISFVPFLGAIVLLVMTLLPPRPEKQKPEWG